MFTTLSVNIQSINAKFDNLLAMLSILHENGFSFSDICIQETWLAKDDDISTFQIPRYHLIHQGKVCSDHGGLIIDLKDCFTLTQRYLYTTYNTWEGLFIDIFNERM